MKIVAITVISLDGRFTRNGEKNIYHWSSPEDFAHFSQVRSEHNLLVMGAGTFDYARKNKQAGLKPEKERLRVIMTKKPKKYAEFFVPGQLEFTDETPHALVFRLEKQGYKRMLFVGGRKLLASFLEAQLIDEILLTIEPRIFGKGEILVTRKQLDIHLQLMEMQKLNEQGTMLLQYKVLHNKKA